MLVKGNDQNRKNKKKTKKNIKIVIEENIC